MESSNIISQYEDSTLLYNHTVKYQVMPEIFSPHSHDVYELIFYKRGDVSYTVDGRRYMLKCNDLVISRPTCIHCIGWEKQSDYERYCILFDESIVPSAILEKLPEELDVVSFDRSITVPNLFEKMDLYCEQLDSAILKSVLTNLISEVLINAVLESENAENYGHAKSNELMSAALSYIDEHLLTLSGLEEICSEMYITKSHLHHIFMKHLNISPKKYITAKRLFLAKRKIAAGIKPTVVYLQCGFTDYSAFYRAYRAYFGHSPSDKAQMQYLRLGKNELLRITGE